MEPYYDRAETVLTAFCEEDYGAITALFDATMQQTLGTEQALRRLIEGIKKTKGAFVKEVARASEVQEDYVVVVLTCLHENGYLDLRVVFDGKNNSRPSALGEQRTQDTTPPPQGVLEKEVSFGTEAYPLKGTLSYPESAPGTGAGGGVGPWLWTM